MVDAASGSLQSWLFVDGSAMFGGHEGMLLRWLEELRAQGHVQVTVLARAGSRLQQEAAAYAAVESLPASPAAEPSIRYPLRVLLRHMLRDAVHFARLLRKLKPQLCIVAEGCLLSQPVFALVASLFRVRVVVYVPLVDESAHMGFGRGVLRDVIVRYFYGKLPRAWVTITHEQAEHFKAWARIRNPIFCLPNTISHHIEQAADIRAGGVTVAANPVRVLVLGRIDQQKGLDFLMDLLEQSPSIAQGLHFSVVGRGPYEAEIRRHLDRSAPLRKVLSLHPWADTVEAMGQQDVLLLASRFEGVPLVMLEAMALGLPVVASDLPGTRALLPRTCLFKTGDMRQAIAIIRRISKANVRNAIVRRNRRCFVAHASGAAFSLAVKELTDCLLDLQDTRAQTASPHKRIAAMPLEEHR